MHNDSKVSIYYNGSSGTLLLCGWVKMDLEIVDDKGFKSN